MDIPRPPSPRRKLRRALWIAGAVGGVALATYGISRLEPAAPSVDEATIQIDSVRRGLMVRTVRGPGTLIPERVRWVPALTGGRVERIHVLPGEEVEAGTLLLELANPDVQLETLDAHRQLSQAQAELVNLQSSLETQRLTQEGIVAQARTEHREAKRRADADRELAARNIIARMDMETSADREAEAADRLRVAQEQLLVLDRSASARTDVQEAQVARLRSIVEFQEGRAASMRVTAGAAGVVQELDLQIGQWVTAGTTLARVVEPGRLNALLRVPESQVRDVAVGQSVEVDTRSGIAPGRVIRIDPAVQSNAVAVEVALEGELPRGARPDLSVDGLIEVDRIEGAVHVGRPAYGQPESRGRVWRLTPDGSHAVPVPVLFGRASLNTIEILEGLEPGDRIILSDMSRWSDFERVRIRR